MTSKLVIYIYNIIYIVMVFPFFFLSIAEEINKKQNKNEQNSVNVLFFSPLERQGSLLYLINTEYGVLYYTKYHIIGNIV